MIYKVFGYFGGKEAMLVLQTGYRQQQLYSTRANRPLSKGHCVVTIKVLKTPQFGKSALEDAAKGKTSISKLSIVDLAGSEHAYTTTTGNQQLKDLEDVDTSLMIPQIVPYRQSKLTQLFQGLLHASPTNLQVSMLVSVNPSRSKFDETARTLEFASSPIESSRARVIDTSDKSSLSLSNTNNPSINPTLITPLAKNTDIENGKSWDHPIDVESKEMDMVEIKSPLFERRDDAPITSGPILCTSSKCQTVISDMQEDFDRQREAFIMKDRARNQEFEVLNEQIVEHMKMIKDQEMAFQRQDDEIRNLKEMLAESEARRIAQESLRVSMDQEVSALRVQMVDIKNRNKTQEEKIQSQDAEICKLEAALAESITNSEAQNANSILQNEIKLLTDRMADDVKKIKELRERVHSQDENTQHLKNEMSEMEASRLALETTHTVTVQFLEADIERLRVELECTKVTQQDQETVKTMFQRMEEELVKQTRALTESLNFKDQLLVENATKDQELARLREALALSERKGISRLEERLESSDYDQSTIVLVKDLVESENIRLSLETQLAKANEIINAWDKWFVQSPGAKLSHISVHASASSPSAAASSHNSSNNSLIALEKTNVDISTIETLAISEGAKIGSVATGALAVIQDAGVLAVEKAAMQENFIEDINETIASQDVSHDSGGETQESQEICPNKEITPACIEGPKSEYQSSSIKSERSSTVSVDPSQSHVVEFIEIESDSEDHDHRTFNQRRNNAQLEHSHTSTQSNSGSSSNASEEESIKSPKSKSIHPKRKSLRSHSLPGDDETSKFSPRSQPTRVARSRYSLPKNLASSNIRTEALQPLVKKARLSTAAKSSLVFKNNNIEEVQESNQVENDQDDSGEQIPLPHIHRTRTSVSLTSDAEDSTCMPGVQSINGSIKSPNAATTQGLIELPIKDDSGDVDKNTDQSSLSSKYNGQPTDLCLEKITHPGHQRSFIAEENIQIDSLQDSGSKAVPSEQHLQRHTTIENMRANNIHRVEDETAVEFEDENQAGLDHKVNGMMAFDKSYENKSSTLSMATPTRLKSSVFEIDDHVGTPEAEISPIRSLYPKLDSMTPFPRQRSPSLPLYHSQYLIESNNHFADSSKSSEILTEESLAHVESLDQFHAALLLHLRMSKGDPHSRHKPYMNVEYPLKTLESRLSNETGSDSDSGVQWEQCKQVEDINMRSGDENDLQGTTSEYDSAQESLDTEDTGGKENDDPNKTIKQLSEADEAKMKATEFEEQQIEMKQTGQNQDEGFRTMIEQNTMAVASRRPKSKKRKLRQKSTIFAEEMNETVDMFEQPAKKDPHKFLARKARNKIKFK
ncbi:hypothetical protein FBU30_001018 [Linnemannia zychae]|nr:hypothetical protein FBU30_001018 [Linnemannia zychae]